MVARYPTFFLLALRYAYGSSHHKALRLMTRICFFSIALGTCALMITLIITNGFEKTIHEKMQGVNADIIVSAGKQKRLLYEEVRESILAEFPDDCKGVSGTSIRQLILHHEDADSVIMLKAIDPQRESEVSILEQKILLKENNGDFPDHQQNSQYKADFSLLFEKKDHRIPLILGKKCAQQYGLKKDDPVTVFIPEPVGKKRIALTKKKCFVAALFSVGLDEYDAHCALTSLEALKELYEEEEDHVAVDMLSLKLSNAARSGTTWYDEIRARLTGSFKKTVLTRLRERYPHLQIKSWQELYPELVSSLILEKYVMFFVIGLITLVACMNLLSLLYLLIQDKRSDIALLKSMGTSDHAIYKLCLQIGFTLTFSATVTGLLCAGIMGYFLQYHALIPLPDVYYVPYLPARMELAHFVFVFLCALGMGLFATIIPAYRAKKSSLIDVLKQQ